MKKRYALLLAVVLTISSLAGCSDDNPKKVEQKVEENTNKETNQNNALSNNSESSKESKVNYDDIVYERLSFFQEGLCAFMYEGKYGYIDENENVVIKPSFDKVYPFSNGYATVVKDKLYGLIDKNGNMIIEPQYAYIGLNEDDDNLWYLFSIEKDGDELYGVLDADKNVVIEPEYENIKYQDGMLKVSKGDTCAYADTSGNFVTDFVYDRYGSEVFYGDLAAVDNGDKVGFINKKGEVVIPFEFNDGESNYGQAIGESYSASPVLFDATGKKLHTFEGYNKAIINNVNGVITYSVGSDDKEAYGLLNSKFEQIVETKYNLIMSAAFDKYLTVDLNDEKGAMNAQGKTIIPLKYYDTSMLGDNLIKAYNESKDYNDIYDMEGNFIKKVDVKYISTIKDTTLFEVTTASGKKGIMNKNFEYVIEPEYDAMYFNYELGRGNVTVKKDGVWELTTLNY